MNAKAKKLAELYQEIHTNVVEHPLVMVNDFTENDFNCYLLVGFQPTLPLEEMIGRVVQVRKETGCFGSDQVFLREYDGGLQEHENQWFYRIPDIYHTRLDKLFKRPEKIGLTYSLSGKHKRKGFIIKSEVKEGESTPMRDIKAAIKGKIAEIINNTPNNS